MSIVIESKINGIMACKKRTGTTKEVTIQDQSTMAMKEGIKEEQLAIQDALKVKESSNVANEESTKEVGLESALLKETNYL